MNDSALLGEAVHGVLRYMAHHPECLDDLEPHYPYIWQLRGLEQPRFSDAQQLRITGCWTFIAGLAREASGYWLEVPGLGGKQPDMLRRMGLTWQVLEFKTSDVHSARQKSRVQIRDVMAELKPRLPEGAVVEGYRITLDCDVAAAFKPEWHKVMAKDLGCGG